MGVKVVLGTGTSSPRFNVSLVPSAPRSCVLASRRVSESDSRNRTAADGTAAQKSAVLIPRETAFTLNGRDVSVVAVEAVPLPAEAVVLVGSAVGEKTV